MVADTHVAAINGIEGLTICGVLSRTSARAAEFCKRHGLGAHCLTIEQLITTRPDFAVLLTPPDARAELARPLISSKIPILTEKPLGRNLTEAQEFVGLCEQAGVPLGVVLQHRYRESARHLVHLIRDGALGALSTVEARLPWWREQSYYDTPGRGTYARDGGGVLLTQAIHLIDLMLICCDRVSEVTGMTGTSKLHRTEVEDFAVAGLRFENGAIGSLTTSVTHYPGGVESLILNGTRASAHLAGNCLTYMPHDAPPQRWGETSGTGGGKDPMEFSANWHEACIRDFAQAVAKGAPAPVSGTHALDAHRLIDAIERAARTGATTKPDTPND